MKKKWNKLAVCSLVIALALFVFTYCLFHYMSPEGCFAAAYQITPVKPFVTLLFGVWGVMFLFAAVMSHLIACIFCGKNEGAAAGSKTQN